MADLREWDVEVEVSSTHYYSGILARTAEEAESIAETLLDDNDEGKVTTYSIEQVVAFPAAEAAAVEELGEDDYTIDEP